MAQQAIERGQAGGSPDERGGLPKQYRPTEHEDRIRALWERSGAFHGDPDPVLRAEKRPYAIVIPPPNVTDRLHLGHALNNTLQDVLVRAHRMMGYETLWMPGTDHAGIATQTVVERRVMKEEGKRRTDFTREEFIGKVQAFKDEYEATITGQLKAMGCSCDWARQRFTMDEMCARAVNEAFFRLFRDGLIYRGKRLVNWDPVTQTALADDEVEMEEVEGKFYYLRYPLVHAVVRGSEPGAGQSEEAREEDEQDAGQGLVPATWSDLRARGYPVPDDAAHQDEEQAWVTVATTRPETYLGDTAVAVNPRDPRAGALRGLLAELPLVGRVIPIIEDEYVVMAALASDGATERRSDEGEKIDPKAAFATGFLKVTPAHDPNDYEIGMRHDLPMINIMAPDASISDRHGWDDVGDAHIFVGKSREDARKLVVREFEARGLLADVKPYRHSVGHSYRSHAAIEPYLSDQWYVRVTDPRMRDAALRALGDDQRSSVTSVAAEVADLVATGHEGRSDGDGGLRFFPERYAKTYETWHENIRDWCISRQLWWGHRIPVWTLYLRGAPLDDPDPIQGDGNLRPALQRFIETLQRLFKELGIAEELVVRVESDAIQTWLQVCSRSQNAAACLDALNAFAVGGGDPKPLTNLLKEAGSRSTIHDFPELDDCDGVHRDPDVLDTWFSSALWPMSTMGWPEESALLKAFNPTNVLCTAREIITLWVSRMVMFNRYFMPEGWPHSAQQPDSPSQGNGNGPLPFRDVFIHAMIQDGEGRKMSKSLGNGVDPLDIIQSHGADAMRFVLCQMTTQTQDVRMPVVPDPKTGRNTSPKFDIGRNFCNKLWNAARFAIGILESETAKQRDSETGAGSQETGVRSQELSLPDRWMLSRLLGAAKEINLSVEGYEFSDYAQSLYDLMWRDFCDWYLEAIKPTAASDPRQRAVLKHVLECIVRFLHPIAPFITEALWEKLREIELPRIEGLSLGPARRDGLLATAAWPVVDSVLRDERAERDFERIRELVTAVREIRAQHNVPPRKRIVLHVPAELEQQLGDGALLVSTLAGLERVTTEKPGGPAAAFTFGTVECHVSNLAEAVDLEAERARVQKRLEELRKQAGILRGRLNNPGYVEKAPAKMVEETRNQLGQVEGELKSLEELMRKHGLA